MYGAANRVTRGEQRQAELQQRDDDIAEWMSRQYSVEVIAELAGVATDYCRKATRRIAAERDIKYNPEKEAGADELLSEDSRLFRSNMAAIVHELRELPDQHPVRLSRAIGLTQYEQVKAKDRPFTHDYKISQIERIAREKGRSFEEVVIWAVLNDPNNKERMQRVLECLNN